MPDSYSPDRRQNRSRGFVAAPAVVKADPFRHVWDMNGVVDPETARAFAEHHCPDYWVRGQRDTPLSSPWQEMEFFTNLHFSITQRSNPRRALGSNLPNTQKHNILALYRINGELIRLLHENGHFSRQQKKMESFTADRDLDELVHEKLEGCNGFAEFVKWSMCSPVPWCKEQMEDVILSVCRMYGERLGHPGAAIGFVDALRDGLSGSFWWGRDKARDEVRILRDGDYFQMLQVGLHEMEHGGQITAVLKKRAGKLVGKEAFAAHVFETNECAYIRHTLNNVAYARQPQEADAKFVEEIFSTRAVVMMQTHLAAPGFVR